MIKPEQIPTEVLAVFRKACDSGDPWSEPWNIADTIAAAINAWPGMFTFKYHDDTTTALILPPHGEQQ